MLGKDSLASALFDAAAGKIAEKVMEYIVSANQMEDTPQKEEKHEEDRLSSKYNAEQLLSIFQQLSGNYLNCTEAAWLYVWGIEQHPVTQKTIGKPKRLPEWSTKKGRKTALAEMIRALKSDTCDKYWVLTSKLFRYDDGTHPNVEQLKSQKLHGPSKTSFTDLISVKKTSVSLPSLPEKEQKVV